MSDCMKYEDEYPGICWDYLWIEESCEFSGFQSLPEILKENMGVEVANKSEFAERFKVMLEKMHEDGVIKPKDA